MRAAWLRLGLASLFLVAAAASADELPIRKKAIDACNKLIDTGKFDKADACVAKLAKDANPVEQRMLFYVTLTKLLAQKKDAEATAHVADAIKRVSGDSDGFEAWLHNASNWVAWTRGDLDGAVAETEGMREAARRKRINQEEGRALMLHYAWDRAYLMLDRALAMPAGADREAAVATAELVRANYHKIADPAEESDGLACLDSYFAARLGRGKEAMEQAKRVDVLHDHDIQDLYVVALGLEAGGDKRGAEALRRKIRTSKNIYPMKPVIVRALERDKLKSPIGKSN